MKRQAAKIASQALAAMCIVVASGAIYRAIGGGPDNTVCTDNIFGAGCYDRLCLWVWLIIQISFTILLAFCLAGCKKEELTQASCEESCWNLYGALTGLLLIITFLVCRVSSLP